MFNDSIRYGSDSRLYVDDVSVEALAAYYGTPLYIYSLRRAVHNYRTIVTAFRDVNLDAHVHYSAKANANLSVLRALIGAGAGIDAVSGGEIFRALKAGARGEDIVFAGVGKTEAELRYALENGVGWFNVESQFELWRLDAMAGAMQATARVALRVNPDVSASTHRHIATGHGAAKFGLTLDEARELLSTSSLEHIRIEGIHVHIGSQLHDTAATVEAVRAVLDLVAPYPQIRTVDIGGGFPVAYRADEQLPALADFAAALAPMLRGYRVLLEPGRAIIADAGILVTRIIDHKPRGEQFVVVVDAAMNDLIRPALYEAHHEIVPVIDERGENEDWGKQFDDFEVVGPVCESADVLGRCTTPVRVMERRLLAILTAGAYGMAMASNYNARPRPAEVVVEEDGQTERLARRRETWDDLVALES